MTITEYFSSLFKGLHSLIKGMEVTGKELVTKKVTEQYPENRDTLQISKRFRGTLQFIYDDEGYHKCIACKSCERNCPNGTIQVITKMIDLDNGKKKMVLDKYMYDLGSCTFCDLCVLTCPTQAIEFSNDFEQSVFRRGVLQKQLNYLPEKIKPTPAPAAKPAAPAAAPAAKPAVAPEKKEETTQPAPAAKPVAESADKPAAEAPQAPQPDSENNENK